MLNGNKIYLRELVESDVTSDYVNWMNDYSIVKYTESRLAKHSLQSTVDFVRNCSDSKTDILFGIFLKDTDLHIGNIKIGNIHPLYKHADVGLIIGRKEYWGKGFATEAIGLVTNYAFSELKIHKLFAGAYAPNRGSTKAFENVGYNVAYVKKDDIYFEGKWIDVVVVEIFNQNGEDCD